MRRVAEKFNSVRPSELRHAPSRAASTHQIIKSHTMPAGIASAPEVSSHEPKQRHSQWDVTRILDQECPASKLETAPDPQMARTFASAIDDIIKGRRPGRRVRNKSRMDKPKSRTDRTKPRSERVCVYCEKCGSSFASVGNLNRHRRVSHQGLRVYCDFPGCTQVR